MSETKNAKIVRTMLGREDHGIPTCMLHLDFGGAVQGFGGYDLRFYGVDMLTRILDVVGVERWEDLPGKHVRVEGGFTNLTGIGHIFEDKWYRPDA